MTKTFTIILLPTSLMKETDFYRIANTGNDFPNSHGNQRNAGAIASNAYNNLKSVLRLFAVLFSAMNMDFNILIIT